MGINVAGVCWYLHMETEAQQATEVTETTTAVVDAKDTPLSGHDRCDSCGAQAYVRATLNYGELLFCLHHATLNKAALEPVTIHWHDESDKLLVR